MGAHVTVVVLRTTQSRMYHGVCIDTAREGAPANKKLRQHTKQIR